MRLALVPAFLCTWLSEGMLTRPSDRSMARPTPVSGTEAMLSANETQGHMLPTQLLSALVPVSPLLALSLAVAGRSEVQMGHSVGKGAALPTSVLAIEPALAARYGVEVMLKKARALGPVLVQGLSASAGKLMTGNLSGAVFHTELMLEKAHAASSSVTTTQSAARGFCILGLFGGVAVIWGLEHVITKYLGVPDVVLLPQDHLTQAPCFRAFSFARFLMAWYVVFYYFRPPGQTYPDGPDEDLDFARWGMVCAPCFFTMSGFSHSYAKLVSSAPEEVEEWVPSVGWRVASWYPLYFISISWSALRIGSLYAEDLSHFLGHVFLLDGFLWETWVAPTFPYFLGSWWLSFFVAYLAWWSPLHHVLAESSSPQLWTVLVIAFIVFVPSALCEVLFMGEWAPFMIFQYWPSFVGGQALAVWFLRNCMCQAKTGTASSTGGSGAVVHKMRPSTELPFLVRYGVTITTLILGFCSLSFSLYGKIGFISWKWAPFLLKGGLAPLLYMFVAGLAAEVDPIARLFVRRPFCLTERLSLGTFFLQVPVQNTVVDVAGIEGLSFTFVASLFVTSIAAQYLVDQPWQRFLKRDTKA